MQLALGAISSIFGGGGAAAGTAAAGTAAAAGTTAAAGTGLSSVLSSGVLSILQGAASAASILAGIKAADIQADSYDDQAEVAQMDKTQEQAEGLQRTTDMKRNLAKVLGENDVAFAASGIDISTGVAADAAASAEKRAAQEISIDRDTTASRMAQYDWRSATYRRMGAQTRRGARLAAEAKTLQTGFDFVARG